MWTCNCPSPTRSCTVVSCLVAVQACRVWSSGGDSCWSDDGRSDYIRESHTCTRSVPGESSHVPAESSHPTHVGVLRAAGNKTQPRSRSCQGQCAVFISRSLWFRKAHYSTENLDLHHIYDLNYFPGLASPQSIIYISGGVSAFSSWAMCEAMIYRC